METTEAIPKKIKGRSPRYPGIALDAALERVEKLYDSENRYATNVQTATAHWGYAPKSGAGAVAVAAMKAYGLVTDAGSGDARTIAVSDLAEDILVREGPERTKAVQAAALRPPAHKDLWDRYGPSLPSDTSLALYLTRERGFTPGGAQELISVYKRTLNFARLNERGATVSQNVSSDSADTQEEAEKSQLPPVRSHGTATARAASPGGSGDRMPEHLLEIPIPLVGGGTARVSLPRQVTPEAWDQMFAVLNALKPAVVAPPDTSDSA